MRDSGIKHYIYGIGTLAGAKKAENLYFKTDEEFNQKAEEILSDKWNVEIYVGSTEKLEITRKQEKNKVYKRFSCIYNTPKYGISVKNHTFWGR